MKPVPHTLLAATILALFCPGRVNSQLQSIPLKGPATNLSSVTYFEPPNDQQVKYRLTGSEMSPLPGALYDVKNLRIEKFNLAGKLEIVVEAPECTYSPLDEYISSPGHLTIRLHDGQVRAEGDGFLWQQGSSSLYISNRVYTLIHTGTNQIAP